MKVIEGIVGLDKLTYDDVVARLMRNLAAQGLDGATLRKGEGIWRGTREPSVTITLAVEAGRVGAAVEALLQTARDARQEAVYLWLPAGEATILDTAACAPPETVVQ